MRGNRLLKWVDFWMGIPLCTVLGGLARRRGAGSALPEAARRILVIKLSAVGDTVLAQPALRSIRQRYPDAHLTWVASPVNVGAAKMLGLADELRTVDLRALASNPIRALGLVRELRKQRFDLAFDFDQWSRLTALLTLLSGAPLRIGFDTRGQGRGLAYNRPYAPTPHTHELDRFNALAQLADATADRDLRLQLPAPAREYAEQLVSAVPPPRVALHPGCGAVGAPRQWPVDRYAAVGDFAARELGAQVFITGGPDETEVTAAVASQMKVSARVLCQDFAFSEFAAVLAQMDVVVCGNTGAMHISAAVGTPTVAIHGPTDPRRWGPAGERHVVLKSPLPCSPCLNLGFEYGCDSHPCMKTVGVDEVCAALLRIQNSGFRVRE